MPLIFPLLNDDTEPNAQLTPEQRALLDDRLAHLVALGGKHGVAPGDAVGLSQTYFDGLYELATRYYRHQHYDAAVLLYAKLLLMKPFDLPYYKGLGACYLAMERYAEAVAAYQAGQFLGALDAELHYYMGLAQYLNHQFDLAFETIRFARVLDEQDSDSEGKIANFATQLLTRMKPLVHSELAKNMDLKPEY